MARYEEKMDRPAPEVEDEDKGSSRGGGERPFMRRGPRRRQKVSKFDEWRVDDIDYKEVEKLKEFLSEHAKLLSRRVTGTRAKHQRRVTRSIKRARYMALLPYVGKIVKPPKTGGKRPPRDGGYRDRGEFRGEPRQEAPVQQPAAEE